MGRCVGRTRNLLMMQQAIGRTTVTPAHVRTLYLGFVVNQVALRQVSL
jgi:hypothetical protein